MKDMTVGKRIILGFSLLMILAVALGTTAIMQMRVIDREADVLATHVAPLSQETGQLLATMDEFRLNARVYGITGYQADHDLTYRELEKVKTHASNAMSISRGHPTLQEAMTAMESFTRSLAAYEPILRETVERQNNLSRVRAAMITTGDSFNQASHAFIIAQEEDQSRELADESVSRQDLARRIGRIKQGNEVIDAGNAIRIANWRGQQQNDLEVFRGAMNFFDVIFSNSRELLADTRRQDVRQSLEAVLSSATAYQKAMQEFLEENRQIGETNQRRARAGEVAAADTLHVLDAANAATTGAIESVESVITRANTLLVVGLLALLALGVASSIFITRSIVNPLNVAIGTMSAGADQTNEAATQVSSASQNLAEGSSEQAASLEEISSSLEEMASMTERNAEHAAKGKGLAKETRGSADTGRQQMEEMVEAVEAIKQSSSEISRIITTIDEIAFQTNILALNAAVEAARAGEAGAGFAVVADEVRSLAQRAAQAAKETAGKIEVAVHNSERGVSTSGKVAESLRSIVNRVRQVDELVGEIATASQEQNEGIKQINLAVSQMDQVTQSNAANAEETASAAEELNAQAQELRGAVASMRQLVGGTHEQTVGRTMPLSKTGMRPIAPKSISSMPARAISPVRARHGTGGPLPLPQNEDAHFRN